MNNKSFIAEVSRQMEISTDDAQMLTYAFVDVMNECFQEGDAVTFSSFGTFEVKKRMERIMVSPNTKKRMLVPPKLVLAFKPSSAIKEKIKNGGQA